MAALALLRTILFAIWLAAIAIADEEEGEQAAAVADDVPMTVTFVNQMPSEVRAK